MPGGPTPVGLACFVAVKFAGYTAAASGLRKYYPEAQAATWKIGLARTAIGVAAGLAYGALWIYIPVYRLPNLWFPAVYLMGLLPLRVAEWSCLLHIFCDRGLRRRAKAAWAVFGGTLWSYCLDAVAIAAAFVVPGGFWVC